MIAIQVRYLGPTNYRGSRVKAMAEGVKSVTLPYNYAGDYLNSDKMAALQLCKNNKWPLNLVEGQLPNGDYVFVFKG